MATQVAAADERLAMLATARDEKQAEIDAQLTQVTGDRASALEGMPDDLLALYEKLRAQQGGVGAAALYQRRCEGCQLELNITELNEIARGARDTVLRCENCRRILVRTSESGL